MHTRDRLDSPDSATRKRLDEDIARSICAMGADYRRNREREYCSAKIPQRGFRHSIALSSRSGWSSGARRMTSFVHIADERDAASIRRTGLKLASGQIRPDRPWGVFALPVVANFLLSHQWVRELKRRGHRTAVGVYFKLDTAELVWAGLYNEPKKQMTAGQAAAVLRAVQSFGFEVIVPHGIGARSITAVRQLPQKLGWRYFPNAHIRGIFCGCQYCVGGQIRSRSIRERYEAGTL